MSTNYIYEDPRPGRDDSPMWDKLLKNVSNAIAEPDKAMMLTKRLWTIRSAGAKLEEVNGSYKIVPLINPEGAWDSMDEWEEAKEASLKPVAAEIKKCLDYIKSA